MAFKVFTKDSLPKYPVKTFFRKLLPLPQKLAFACAEKEGYFTKYPKASESIKELMQGPMYAWVPSLIGGGSKQLDKLNRAEREFNWKQEAEKRKAEALTKAEMEKAFNDAVERESHEWAVWFFYYRNMSYESYQRTVLGRKKSKIKKSKAEEGRLIIQKWILSDLEYMKSLLREKFTTPENLPGTASCVDEIMGRIFNIGGSSEYASYEQTVAFLSTYASLSNALQSDARWKKIIDGLSHELIYMYYSNDREETRKYFSLSIIPTKHIKYAKQKFEDAFLVVLKDKTSDFRISFNEKRDFIDNLFLQFPPQLQSQSIWHKMIDYFIEEMGKNYKLFDSFEYFKKVPKEHFDYLWKAFITQIIQNPFEHYSFDVIKQINIIPKKYENYALSQLNIYWSGYISSTIFEQIITLNEPYKTHILKNNLKSPDCYLKTRIAAYETLEDREATFNEKIWIYHIQRLAKKGKTEKLENELKGSNLS